MAYTHKLYAYQELFESINACDKFDEKLTTFFGGEIKEVQTKEDGNYVFFYNKKFRLFKVVKVDFRIPKQYKNYVPSLIPMGARDKVMMESFTATLDSNFKVVPKPINDDWAGVCWSDLLAVTRKQLKI